MSSVSKRRATAKSGLTKVLSQLATHQEVPPHRRDCSALKHLKDLLSKAESTYSDTIDGSEELSSEDTGAYESFMRGINETNSRINTMIEQRESYQLYNTLSQEIEDWEETKPDDLPSSFSEEYPRLLDLIAKFRVSACTTGAEEIPELKAHVKDLRRRLTKLKTLSTLDKLATTKAKESDCGLDDVYSQVKKARTVPLPVFSGDLADWRSFWRRFQEYVGKLRHITDDERLSYLQECLKDHTAQDIVTDSIRNGDTFEEVEKRLNKKFDQPREVFVEALRSMLEMPQATYSRSSLARLGKDFNRFRNILLRYGDNSADQVFTALVETKMNSKLLEEWKLFVKDSDKIPPGSTLIEFCDQRELVLGITEKDRHKDNKVPFRLQSQVRSGPPVRSGKFQTSTTLHSSDSPPCGVCQSGHHPLYICPDFKAMDLSTRHHTQQQLRACYNCLGTNHSCRQCPSKKTCQECGGKHHTLLHKPSGRSVTSATQPSAAIPAQTNSTTHTSTSTTTPSTPATSLTVSIPDKTALLLSCQVILDINGRTQKVRAMLDPGSTLSFLTTKVATTLRAKRIPYCTTITGLSQSHAATSNYRVDAILRAVDNPHEPPISLSPSVVTSITDPTPASNLTDHQDLAFTKNLKLADPNFGAPGRVDLLLGQDVLSRIMRHGLVNSTSSNLYGQNTIFGWVVGGYCSSPSQAVTAHICCRANGDNQTDQLLRAFWETEEVPSDIQHLSTDDQSALDQFRDSVSRGSDGRYSVRLPKRDPAPPLGHSKAQARKRYELNEKALRKRGNWEDFLSAVKDYGAEGHAEVVPPVCRSKPDSAIFYMPMHGVVKEASTSTKLRIVFDASARSSTGYSLNDTLLSGPTLYPLLTSILIQFRQHTIGMSADISRMFREVSLHPDDRDLHRYVLKNDEGEWEDWRMTRVTFGVTSSPFLATQVLRQLAEDYQLNYPKATSLVKSSFYVDDCLTGASSLEEAVSIRHDLNQLLYKGQMTLRKWRTNSPDLKATIPEELLEKEEVQLISAPSACHKALGVHWNTSQDSLHVATPVLSDSDSPTKRQVLSDIARTFDVLGWFSPVTISLKIMLQQIWHLELDWDQTIPSDLSQKWQTWRQELPLITSHPLSRCYFQPGKQPHTVQLHGFCDASQLAYAGMVYIRITYTDTTVSTALIIAKSKVAPVRPVTIPKLELCSAVLLSKLLATVRTELNIATHDVYAWSDSTITLSWINTSPHRLKTYVANRVTAITSNIPATNWRHVSSDDNPADLGSRGTTAGILLQSELWWNGPAWLLEPPVNWPLQSYQRPVATELKRSVLTIRADSPREDLSTRYSSYHKLTHVMAWMYRFYSNSKGQPPDRVFSSQLSVREIEAAETKLFQQHQQAHMTKELASLKSGSSVPRSSPLHSLHPILDSNNIVRVGGRLSRSELSYTQRHPVILHKRAPLSRLLVQQLHVDHHHAGPTLLMGILARDHYLIGARQLVRKVSRECVTCQRSYARTSQQLMGNLPPARIRPAPPFSKTGVDFAGPVTLKRGHTRKPSYVKAYISLFVCLVTKSIHLELVGDLSTPAFLAAFRRFVARRGCPEEMISDNGTNFVGANRELQQLYTLFKQQETQQEILYFTNLKRISWTFSPGRAPHFGGLWEAGVKAAKSLLRKLLGSYTLTTEEYATVLTEVEAALNSRPLCPLETLPEDGLEVLTPGHFLVGRPLTATPHSTLQDFNLSSHKRWNLCQKLSLEFWHRWSREYLQLLQKRSKWRSSQRDLQIGDVVLLKDQDLFNRSWPLARISHVHPGSDGHVRAVTVQTQKGSYLRPVTKIVPLVTDHKDSSSDPETAQPHPPGGCSGQAVPVNT